MHEPADCPFGGSTCAALATGRDKAKMLRRLERIGAVEKPAAVASGTAAKLKALIPGAIILGA